MTVWHMTTDDALEKCSEEERTRIMEKIMMRMEEYLNYRGKGEIQVGAVTFSNVYPMYMESLERQKKQKN